jgi:hypothetical protein
VPKHVGNLVIVIAHILLSAFVGGYIVCKDMHGMNNVKLIECFLFKFSVFFWKVFTSLADASGLAF